MTGSSSEYILPNLEWVFQVQYRTTFDSALSCIEQLYRLEARLYGYAKRGWMAKP